MECAKVLIAFGANLNSVDREDHTPLDTATSARRPVYLKSFARQGSVSTPWTFVCTDSGVYECVWRVNPFIQCGGLIH